MAQAPVRELAIWQLLTPEGTRGAVGRAPVAGETLAEPCRWEALLVELALDIRPKPSVPQDRLRS